MIIVLEHESTKKKKPRIEIQGEQTIKPNITEDFSINAVIMQ